MAIITEISAYLSKLTDEEIRNLPEDVYLNCAMERPFHPGQYGFMFDPEAFESIERMSEVMAILMKRMPEIDNLEEKMAKIITDRMTG